MPPPSGHGDDLVRVAEDLGRDPSELLDLAASRNPVAPDPAPVVARHVEAVHHYPDERRAHGALAESMGVDPARLVLTNGGAEAIALVAAEHPLGWVEEPEFALYRHHLAAVRPGAPRWASDPHNPSGRLADPGERASVWDEAFFPLATGSWTRRSPDATVVGSLTKLLACPGLRAGYVLAPDGDEAARIAAWRPRWSVNALACAALPELLARVDLPSWAEQIAVLRRRLVRLLEDHGFEPWPSAAPWVVVPGAAGLRSELLREGVLVRDCASFGLGGHVRIAVPDPEGMERLGRALAARRGGPTRPRRTDPSRTRRGPSGG